MDYLKFMLIIYIFSLFASSVNSLKEKEVITKVEDLITLVNSQEFQEFSAQYEEDEDLDLQFSLFNGDECLMPSKEAKNILKSTYGKSISSPTKELRFILGKCNPVLMIPGIYASKLLVELNCKKLAQFERETTFKEIRLYCGDSVCKDESKESEEHPLFVALLDKAFTLLGSENDKYSSCLGYFMNYFQNESECPTSSNGKKLCYYSPYVKVGFYGGTTQTQTKGKCGVEGVQNVIQSGSLVIDGIVNIGAAKSFKTMHKRLTKRGYQEGFSLGGLPNDYRRYLATNNFAANVFRSQIERLYQNTGKKVVIVAHSYGTLLTLSNLVNTKNQDLLPKIKKFIAVAPPFAGSSKLLDVFLHGMNDWNKSFDILGKEIKITNYNIFGQFMMYKTLPTITELRPLPIAAKLFTSEEYKSLGDALRERISYERKCRNNKCPNERTPKFDEIFRGYYPSVSDSECIYESIESAPKTLSRKCFTELYNVGECPTVLTKYSNNNPYNSDIEQYCGQTKPQFYYQGECDGNNSNCLDRIYSEKGPYVFNNKEAVNYLVNRYNKDFAKKIDNNKLSERYFDSFEEIKDGSKQSIEYHNKISLIKDLPAPPVDTDVIYASFAETPAAFILREDDFTAKGDEFRKGGDDTVPTWSSLLTGLKWLYDKKKDNLKPNYKLVEYCSRLSDKGKYKFDPKKEQNFIALGCECLNSRNQYKKKFEDCTHAAMINDDSLIDYVISVADDPKVNNEQTPEKKNAVNNYDSKTNYESLCNADLKRILETVK